MTIKQCKKCGAFISDIEVACQSCGAKVGKGLFLKIALWILVGFIILSGVMEFTGVTTTASKTTSSKTSTGNGEAASQVALMGSKGNVYIEDHWVYDYIKDDLRDNTTEIAENKSLNEVNFDFPYNGGSNLILNIRKNHTGTDLYFVISRGQFLCGLIDGCDIAFRFDDGEILKVRAIGSDSHASDILFIKNTSMTLKLIEKIKKSKKLIVAPKFYQYGEVQFTFDVSRYRPI